MILKPGHLFIVDIRTLHSVFKYGCVRYLANPFLADVGPSQELAWAHWEADAAS